MEKAITVPGLNMAQDKFLIAVEQVGKKRHVLTNTRTAIVSSDSLIGELPHDAVADVKIKGMLSLGVLGKVIAVVTGGGGPKTVLQLVPKQGASHAPLNLKFSMMNQRAMLRFLVKRKNSRVMTCQVLLIEEVSCLASESIVRQHITHVDEM